MYWALLQECDPPELGPDTEERPQIPSPGLHSATTTAALPHPTTGQPGSPRPNPRPRDLQRLHKETLTWPLYPRLARTGSKAGLGHRV